MLKTKYRIIQIDHSESTAYWIEKTTYLFGWRFWVKTIGDYKMDSDFGELGDMPFFLIEDAETRVKILKREL